MNLKVLYQWTDEIANHLPSLNCWQVVNLALFSYAVVLSEDSQQTAIARRIACGEKVASAVKRLQRFIGNTNWCDERFFVAWASWVLGKLKADSVSLLVDETKLKDRLGIMMVGLAFENRCIPLVWTCYRANSQEDYPAEGQVGMIAAMLRLIQKAMPANTAALLLADRGIGTSPALCRRVEGLGFKYLFRITKQCKMRLGDGDWESILEKARRGEIWQAQGAVFKKRGRLPTNIRAIWDRDCAEPWLLISNDPNLSETEYARRNWQEQSFRDLKSGGWNWMRSYVRCPRRMTRFIAILVLAYAWMIGLGCHAVEQNCATALIQRSPGTWRRKWSLFKEGLLFFYNDVLRKGICPPFYLIADKRLC